MKKILLIPLAALLLTGCGLDDSRPDVGVAPAAKMPDLPSTLKKKAERLPDITDGSLGGIHTDGSKADSTYNDLAFRYNALVDAWGCVADALNNRTTEGVEKCFSEAKPE
jgi:hypothetical protein